MLAKQLAIGSTPASLVKYLYGAGRANEHENQRLIAGSERLTVTFSPLDVAHDLEVQAALAREFDGAWRQVRRERGLPLEVPEGEKVRGAARGDRVYHATLSLGTHEGSFTDAEWAKAARMFVVEMGFIDDKNGLADCAWLAVHHGSSKDGNDHVHIAVNLVREDGRRADIHQSKRRTAQAGARVAGAMGKDAVFEAELTSGIGNVSRPEWERARAAKREPDRVIARRILEGAAAAASSESDFIQAARAAGLVVLPRRGTPAMSSPTGYSVKLRDANDGIFYSPSKMDKALGLDELRRHYGWGLRSQLDAIDVWHGRKSLPASSTFRLPVADKIQEARAQLEDGQRNVHWRPLAREASTILGAWSVVADAPQDRYLGRASDALLKASQRPRSTGREIVGSAAQTMVLVSQAASANDTAGRLALLMQMMQLVDAIARRADAERDLAKARQELERAAAPLRAERSILEAMHKRETLPASWSVVNGDPVARVIRDLQQAERRSGPDKPVPPPPPRRTTDTSVPRPIHKPRPEREPGPER